MGHELREDGAARQHPAFWRDRSPQAICPKNASAEEISSPRQIRENSCGLNRLYGFSCAMTGHQWLGSSLAIPLLERLVRDFAFDEQLREFSALCLALERHATSDGRSPAVRTPATTILSGTRLGHRRYAGARHHKRWERIPSSPDAQHPD